jgi:exopolyphosphatase/guanosine-5'-triphosphate,3'-diphosphate pyrophosphatase
VEADALALFDALRDEHQLGGRERLLLRCAAILHDVGLFVNARAHHKHSMYLILNSDLFGLTRRDMQLVATVSRYHRKALPSPAHPEFAGLAQADRMTVAKLAALLRVADALERSHRETPRTLEFLREGDRFVILLGTWRI